MQLTIKGRNLEVNDQLRGYVEKKLGKMDRYLPDIQEMRVELAEEKSRKASEREVVQVTIRSNGQPAGQSVSLPQSCRRTIQLYSP